MASMEAAIAWIPGTPEATDDRVEIWKWQCSQGGRLPEQAKLPFRLCLPGSREFLREPLNLPGNICGFQAVLGSVLPHSSQFLPATLGDKHGGFHPKVPPRSYRGPECQGRAGSSSIDQQPLLGAPAVGKQEQGSNSSFPAHFQHTFLGASP